MNKPTVLAALLALTWMGTEINVNAQTESITTAKNSAVNKNSRFEFAPLPYDTDALEPYIDKETVELHYNKHHKSYHDKFTAAIKGTEMETMDIKSIFKKVSKYPATIRENGGGYYNHTLYWEIMTPKGSNLPSGKFKDAINNTFGTLDKFKSQFTDSAKNRFGSGWAWLSVDSKGKLFISTTPNQDNPLMDVTKLNGTPILGLDVWEHAYYKKYENRRPDYIDAFWNVVHWEAIAKKYDEAVASVNKK